MAEQDFTEDERAIWRAAYAAAFVSDFERMYTDVPIRKGPFDTAARCTTAERAITVADLAIHRLRQWRHDERALAGVQLDKLPKEWEDD